MGNNIYFLQLRYDLSITKQIYNNSCSSELITHQIMYLKSKALKNVLHLDQVSYSPANPPSTVADGESASPMCTESEPPDSVAFSKSDIPKNCLDNSTICHEI